MFKPVSLQHENQPIVSLLRYVVQIRVWRTLSGGTGYIRLSQHENHKSKALLAHRGYAVP